MRKSNQSDSYAEQIAKALRHIYVAGLTTTSGGNLSILDDEGNLWISPAGKDKGRLEAIDVVCVRASGEVVGNGRASSELPVHQEIRARRPELKAVIHAHPEALVSYALAGRVPELQVIAGMEQNCGKVVFADYRLPSSRELGEVIAVALEAEQEATAVIMESHGVVLGAESMDAALVLLESLEFAARAMHYAAELGGVQPIKNEPNGISKIGTGGKTQSQRGELTAQKNEVLEFVQRMYRQGFIRGVGYGMSLRVDAQTFVITPEGVPSHRLDESALCVVSAEQLVSGELPVRRWLSHAKVYAEQPEIRSIVETRSPAVMGHALAHVEIDVSTNPESRILVGQIAKLPLGADVAEVLSVPQPVVLIENDCLVAAGGSAVQAFDRAEIAEFTARSNIMAARIGSPKQMSEAQVQEMLKAFFG